MGYMKLADQVLKTASADGAEAETYIAVGKETNIVVRNGKVEKLSYAGSKGLGLRIIRAGKMGYAYTSDFSPGSLAQAVSIARELVSAVDADEHRRLPEPQDLPEDDLQIYDPAILETPIENKVDFALAVERAALESDPRVVMTLMVIYLDGAADVFLVNSKGFLGSYKKSFAASFTQAMAVEGEERAVALGLGVGTSRKSWMPMKSAARLVKRPLAC